MYPQKDVEEILNIFSEENPDPKIELDYVNHFTLLVAIILSAQAKDESVNKATKILFAKYETPQDFILLGENRLQSYVNSIGLYRNKSKNIIACSTILLQEYASTIPGDFSKLIKLPGVGRKTANVFLNVAFGHDTMPVDTHVFRVSKRIGLASANNVLEVEKELIAKIPKQWLNRVNSWLVLHGRYICKAKKPLCGQCKIQQYCKYYKGE